MRYDRSAAKPCKTPGCSVIIWRKDVTTGKNICLDASPIADEDRVIIARKWCYIVLGPELCRVVTAAEWGVSFAPELGEDGKPTGVQIAVYDRHMHPTVHLSHWRTCIDPERWRNWSFAKKPKVLA